MVGSWKWGKGKKEMKMSVVARNLRGEMEDVRIEHKRLWRQ
jgi:hypothetical protein